MEQRRAKRFDLHLPIELLRTGESREPGSGETKNVSSIGVLFSAEVKVQPGDVVEYLITLPTQGDGTGARLRCIGKVVRREEDGRAAVTLERYEFVRANGQ